MRPSFSPFRLSRKLMMKGSIVLPLFGIWPMSDTENIRKRKDLRAAGLELNPQFIEYYRSVLVPSQMDEKEFDHMLEVFHAPLPNAFRLAPGFDNLQSELESHISKIRGFGTDLIEINALPPEFGKIYQICINKSALRKNPNYMEFRDWLNLRTEAGQCHRQEFVSMIPPYFLDVNPSDTILDCCASPGSKTAQILQMMQIKDQFPSGLVIANDIEPSRCWTLIHQLGRLGAAHGIVTCYPAQHFPDIAKFDRILCDVICSGDGTLRKNIDAGSKWKLKNSENLHAIQRQILQRCLQLLKVGGTLVYSTCSMNPIEDEAVIGSVLTELGNAVELVDQSGRFPNLKRSKGLKTWKVSDDSTPTMAPQGREDLDRCMRFYPHQNDSGAFFVAVLRKNSEVDIKELPLAKPLTKWKEAAFLPISKASPDVAARLREDYGFGSDFKDERLFVRAEGHVKNVYYLSDRASALVGSVPCEKLRCISAGTRVFAWKGLNDESAIKGFPSTEGVDLVSRFATKRKYYVNPQEAMAMLKAGNEGIEISGLANGSMIASECVGGCFILVEGSNSVFGGARMKGRLAVQVKAEVIPKEIMRLELAFPGIFEHKSE